VFALSVAERFGRKWRKTKYREGQAPRGRGRKRAWVELDGGMEEGEPPPLSELLLV